jgi:hypothetical protein
MKFALNVLSKENKLLIQKSTQGRDDGDIIYVNVWRYYENWLYLYKNHQLVPSIIYLIIQYFAFPPIFKF